MSRIRTSAPTHISPLSGLLQDALKRHAYERCRHYFFYAFYLQALVDQWSQRTGQAKSAADYVLTKASHQIDSGHRDNASHYHEFERSAEVVKLAATAFKQMDAAHFCNLGVCPALQSGLAGGAPPNEIQFYQNLCAIMGNTRLLPQQVNIGPDRIIDQLHGRLILEHLNLPTAAKPIATQYRIRQYLDNATLAVSAYQQLKIKENRAGLAVCAKCYVDAYRDPQIYNALCNDILRAIEEDCAAYGLQRDLYVA